MAAIDRELTEQDCRQQVGLVALRGFVTRLG